MTWAFDYDGPVMGAVRMTQRSKFADPRARKYARLKHALRMAANVAGIPDELDTRKAYAVEAIFRFKGRARYDIDNLGKFVLDALWKQDRRVLSLSLDVMEYRESEDTTITVREIQEGESDG